LPHYLQYLTGNSGFEFWSSFPGGHVGGRHNLMKGAFVYADRIMFVSHGHMREALTISRGYGLSGVLNAEVARNPQKLTAVYNGIRANKHKPEFLTPT
jgi:glycogen synthase